MTPRRSRCFFSSLVLTVLRLVYAAQLELFPDESYYYMWSERMDIWATSAKGPGVAAAIWLGTHLFGVNEFGVRVLSPLLRLGTSLLAFSFARRLYGESVGIWTVLMINVLPIFNVGSVVMTIDPLSIFFWTAALYTFWLALERSPQFSALVAGTGALIGLGFLCKYTNAMQLVSIVLLLAITRKYRREFRRQAFGAMLAVALLFTLPPIIWNAQHDWVTLSHLSARGGLHKGFRVDLSELGQFIGLHFRRLFAADLRRHCIVAAVWGVGWRARNQWTATVSARVFPAPLRALLWLSLKQAGEANWTAPSVDQPRVLAVALWHERARTSARRAAVCLRCAGVGLVCSVVILNLGCAPRARRAHWPYDLDPGARMRGWRTAAAKVEAVRARLRGKDSASAFSSSRTSMRSRLSLAFYMQDKRPEGPAHPPVYIPESQEIQDQFSFWRRYDEFVDAAGSAADSAVTSISRRKAA